jgi:hypothetical protein
VTFVGDIQGVNAAKTLWNRIATTIMDTSVTLD